MSNIFSGIQTEPFESTKRTNALLEHIASILYMSYVKEHDANALAVQQMEQEVAIQRGMLKITT